MKHLVLVSHDNQNNVVATYYNETNPLFAYMSAIAQTQTRLQTTDDVVNNSNGVIYSDELSEIETLMREIGFRTCDKCGAWVTPQDRRTGASTYRDGTRRCANCEQAYVQEQARNRYITLDSYHSTSGDARVINARGESFDLSNVFGLGIEMEMNSHESMLTNGAIKTTEAFYNLANPHKRSKVFRCEQDCTVQAEIISNVFTKKSLYDFDWNVLTDCMKLNKNDESIANVGFHVHLSKIMLGSDEKEQCLNFLKLQYFLKCYESDWLKLSGRKPDEMRWCSFYTMQQIDEMKRDILRFREPWDCMPESHGYALISSDNTIELRIGKSTNDPVKIDNYLKLVYGIVENIKNVPFEKVYCLRKVFRLVPKQVLDYMHNCGLFLNTNAKETRGVTL